MARITVEDCLEKVDNQYDLVLLAKSIFSQVAFISNMFFWSYYHFSYMADDALLIPFLHS